MRAPPRLLVIDTATETVAVAACGPSGEALATAPGAAESSTHLLPAVQDVLRRAGLDPAQAGGLDAIAFGAGPGAFTGLRTACAAAQGLAFGLGCPVIALDSLMAWAEDAPWSGLDAEVWVAVDARMDEVYAASYRGRSGAWTVVTAPALYALDALAEAWRPRPPHFVAGNALAAFGPRLPAPGAQRHDRMRDRPAALLRLARAAWVRGEVGDAAAALPMYLRDKVALTTAERAAAAAARALA